MNCKIIIVEDEIISKKYLELILKNLGYKNIYTANSSIEAISICKKEKIDLAFMDIDLDGPEDGIHCAMKLNYEYFLPIIYTTGYNDSSTINEVLDTNVFAYVLKPFEQSHIECALLTTFKRIKIERNKIYQLNNDINDTIIDLGQGQLFNLSKNIFFDNNKYINLTKIELELLKVLIKNINGNTSFEILRQSIWKNKKVGNSAIRDVMSRLRKKAPNLNLHTISGLGYTLVKL